jgi:hypothetical protein
MGVEERAGLDRRHELIARFDDAFEPFKGSIHVPHARAGPLWRNTWLSGEALRASAPSSLLEQALDGVELRLGHLLPIGSARLCGDVTDRSNSNVSAMRTRRACADD